MKNLIVDAIIALALCVLFLVIAYIAKHYHKDSDFTVGWLGGIISLIVVQIKNNKL